MAQSPLVLRPPELQPLSLIRPGDINGSGDSVAPWVLLTQTEQGASPFDPANRAPGASFDSSTGLFTWPLQAGDTTLVDGFSDSMARWTARLIDLYPDFDPLIDVLGLAWVPGIPFSAGNVSRFGMGVGILSGAAAGPYQGRMFGTVESGAAYLNTMMSSTAAVSTDGVAATLNLQLSSWDATGPGATIQPVLKSRTGATWEDPPTLFTAPISVDVSTWRIHVGHLHNTATAAVAIPPVTARVWHRRIRTSGVTGLP